MQPCSCIPLFCHCPQQTWKQGKPQSCSCPALAVGCGCTGCQVKKGTMVTAGWFPLPTFAPCCSLHQVLCWLGAGTGKRNLCAATTTIPVKLGLMYYCSLQPLVGTGKALGPLSIPGPARDIDNSGWVPPFRPAPQYPWLAWGLQLCFAPFLHGLWCGVPHDPLVNPGSTHDYYRDF